MYMGKKFREIEFDDLMRIRVIVFTQKLNLVYDMQVSFIPQIV